MRIARQALVTPPHNSVFATGAVALSIIVFAYSGLLGPIAVLAYYAVWLPLAFIDKHVWLSRPGDYFLVLAFIAFVLASTLWSPAPAGTMRGALQLLTHLGCAVIAARVVDGGALTRGMMIGTLVVVLYSLAFGRFAYDVMDESYTFVGAFGSKNQLALFCSLGIYFSLALIMTGAGSRLSLVASVIVVAVLGAALVASRSATSTISLIIAAVTLIFLLAALRIRPRTRTALLLFLLPCFIFAVAVAFQLGAMDTVLAAFGKDSTLTGRTYLWSQGIAAGNGSPAAGTGYQAYWLQGSSEAERLWEEFYIENRFGFHFHNTYIEVFVELGYIGLSIYIALLCSILLGLLWHVATRTNRYAAVLLGVYVLLLIRSFFEVDSLYPYTVGSFLIVFLAVTVRGLSAKSANLPEQDLNAAAYPNSFPEASGLSTRQFGLSMPASAWTFDSDGRTTT